MSEFSQGTAELCAILDLFTYLDVQTDYEAENMTLDEIVSEIERKYAGRYDETSMASIKAALENHSEYKNIKLVAQSHSYADELALSGSEAKYEGVNSCNNDLIGALAFVDESTGSMYVVYRGTGDGRWVDNGRGFVDESTPMQEASTRFFDRVYEQYGGEYDVYVSGHSKGGNEAQYVAMTSKYAHEIDGCYSFDGQGFSDAAIEKFRQRGDYDEILSRMYAINGTNDFVSVLINPIIPAENTYYLNYTKEPENITDFVDLHVLQNLITDGRLNWMDGDIHGKRGEFANTISRLNEAILELPDEEKASCAVTVMSLLEIGEKYGGGLDGDHADLTDILTTILVGIPTLAGEGLEILAEKLITLCFEKFGGGGALAGDALLTAALSFLASCDDLTTSGVELIAKVGTTVSRAVKGIVGLTKTLFKAADQIADAFFDLINAVSEMLSRTERVMDYVNDNDLLEVDTYKLKNYAMRLRIVNGRLVTLDEDLDSLYWKVGLLDLWNLVRADILTHYSFRLELCAKYLDDTAEIFADAEAALLQDAPGGAKMGGR